MQDPVLIGCAHCGAGNRLAHARLVDGPVCGRCKQPLFDGKPLDLTDRNFTDYLRRTDLPVLVDCWAPWCQPCLQFAPTFKAAVAQLEPQVKLVKLDTEANPQTAAALNIRSIPTLILLGRGRELARISGAMPLPSLLKWVQQGLSG